jgi:hypothetical protein
MPVNVLSANPLFVLLAAILAAGRKTPPQNLSGAK